MEGDYAVPGARKRAHVHDNGPSDPQPVAQVNPFNVLNWDSDAATSQPSHATEAGGAGAAASPQRCDAGPFPRQGSPSPNRRSGKSPAPAEDHSAGNSFDSAVERTMRASPDGAAGPCAAAAPEPAAVSGQLTVRHARVLSRRLPARVPAFSNAMC